MALTIKEIELVNLGASIAAGCKPCTTYHIKKVKEAVASDEEIKNTIRISVGIRYWAGKEMENHAMNDLGIAVNDKVDEGNLKIDRIKVLVSIGSSFAINCASLLDKNIRLGNSLLITDADLNRIFKAVKLIKMKAALYVDKIALGLEENITARDECGCESKENYVQPAGNKSDTNIEKGCC